MSRSVSTLLLALCASTVPVHAAPPLDLSPPRPGAPPNTAIGGGWRHGFEIVLTARGDGRVVHDADGSRHVFEPDPRSGSRTDGARGYSPIDGDDARLEEHADGHRWFAPDGREVHFVGSLPTRIDRPGGATSTLRYADGRLVTVQAGDGSTVRLRYRDGRLRGATSSDGTEVSLTLDPDGNLSTTRRDGSGACLPASVGSDAPVRAPSPSPDGPDGAADPPSGDGSSGRPDDERAADTVRDEEERCDSDANPPGPGFANGPGIPGALRLDVRPASCRSHFVERHGTDRGFAIERDLEHDPHYAGYAPTVRSFPIADFVGTELRVVRSRDLALPSLDAVPDGVFARLMRDGDEIESRLLDPLARDGEVSVREGGRTTTLHHRPDRPVVLELVVRHGFASADQIAQIGRARRELLAHRGIVLRVIEIP